MRRQICGDLGFRIYWLGLQSSAINVTKFLVVPVRSLRVGSLSIVGAGVGTISFKRRLMSNATLNSIPFSINNSKGKELKIVSAATDQSSHQMIGAKDGSYCYSDRDEMGTAQDDQKEIEAMMVQELRATLRKLGIPVKGRKQELISTLRLHMGNRFQGELSGAEEKETTCSTISEIVALKRKLRSSEGSTIDNRFNSDAYGNEHHGMIRAGLVGLVGPEEVGYGDIKWDEKGHNMISHILVSFDLTITSIQFGYLKNGSVVLSEMYGKSARNFRLVKLNQAEYITGLSGAMALDGGIQILTFHTNHGKHGPIGQDGKKRYSVIEIDLAKCDRCEFSGFFGTYNPYYLTSIGIYLSPIASSNKVVKREHSWTSKSLVESFNSHFVVLSFCFILLSKKML